MRKKKYTHCTIDTMGLGKYLAKVAYSENSKTWDPTHVKFHEKWIPIDEWDNMEGYNSYCCEDYRSYS